MANTLITPSIIAREALMVLRNNAVMANLVHRDYSNEFVASIGDTITIRKPAKFEAKEFSSRIEIQNANESSVEVKMDKHLDVSFAVTSKEMTMDIADFSDQFIIPAMRAFADKVDSYLIALESDVTSRHDISAATTIADIVATRKFLTDNAVPLTNRRFVYDGAVEADLLNIDLFTSAEKVGDAGTALREASLGRKFGLDFYTDQNIKYSTDHTPAIMFHKNAFALVTRPLALPNGATKSAIMNYDGFGLRVVYGYDITTKTDTVSIDMLCGVKTLDEKMAAVMADKRPQG